MKKKLLSLNVLTLVTLLASCASPVSSSSSLFSSSSSSDISSSSSSDISSSSSSDISSSSLTISSSSTSSGEYYSSIDWSAEANTLKTNLNVLLKSKCTYTFNYKENNTTMAQTDKDTSGKTTKIVGFYDRTLIGPSWDSGKTWNKEHVWPNSRGVGTTGPGADPHMLRPTAVSVNSSRGNKFYGASNSSTTYDPGSEGYPEFRGMAARIIFYMAVRYSDLGLSLSDNPSDDPSLKTMGKVSDLLKWNLAYPVDPLETQRNEYIYKRNGVRNPFIDHPEAATTIWGS